MICFGTFRSLLSPKKCSKLLSHTWSMAHELSFGNQWRCYLSFIAVHSCLTKRILLLWHSCCIRQSSSGSYLLLLPLYDWITRLKRMAIICLGSSKCFLWLAHQAPYSLTAKSCGEFIASVRTIFLVMVPRSNWMSQTRWMGQLIYSGFSSTRSSFGAFFCLC